MAQTFNHGRGLQGNQALSSHHGHDGQRNWRARAHHTRGEGRSGDCEWCQGHHGRGSLPGHRYSRGSTSATFACFFSSPFPPCSVSLYIYICITIG